jgi:hypothetical protein
MAVKSQATVFWVATLCSVVVATFQRREVDLNIDKDYKKGVCAGQQEVGENGYLVQPTKGRTGQVKSSFITNRYWLEWWPFQVPTSSESLERCITLDQTTTRITGRGRVSPWQIGIGMDIEP